MGSQHHWYPITSREQFISFVVDQALDSICVFFTAPSCFRCGQIAPKVAGFPDDFPAIYFYSIDVDSVPAIGDFVDITTLPTFILYRNGKEVHRLEGVPQQRPARALAQALKQHLSIPTSP